MARLLSLSLLLIAMSASGSGAIAGYDEKKTTYQSDSLAKSSTHVIVGRVVGYREAHPPASAPAPAGMKRFEAEIVVDRIEAGSGLRPGDRIAVGFWSERSKEQIETMPILGSDCADYQVPPQPGDLARVYLNRDEHGGFLSDHPTAFFALDPGPRRPYVGRAKRPEMASVGRWGLWIGLGGCLGLIALIGLFRSRFAGPRAPAI